MPGVQPTEKEHTMSSLMTRGGLFDDFFKDIAPGFYVRPLHGDPLPSPAQIKVDVKETDKGLHRTRPRCRA
jgi:hypothetical protein